MKKKIIALLLSLVMLVGIIPAAVYAAEGDPKVTLLVEADKALAVAGDEITYTVTMKTEYALTALAFYTAFPAGLDYVDNSGAVDPNAKAILNCDDFAWVEWSTRIGAEKGDNKLQAFASVANKVSDVVLCTFKVTVAEDAALGEYKMELIGLDEFMDDSWEIFAAEDIAVESTPVTVVDHICADNLTEVAAKDAACTEDGNSAYYVCDVCGIKYVDADATEVAVDVVIPATGHTEAEATVENKTDATCTEEGSYDSVVYCSVCGEELSREEGVVIPAGDGHTEGAAVKENEVIGDCVTEGSYDSVVYCVSCGEELSREEVVVPVTGHDYVAVVTAPTCLDAGFTTNTCSVCGDEYVSDIVAAAGHKADKVVIVDPTATKEGSKKTYCSVCDTLLEDEVIEKADGKVVVTVANGTNTLLTGIVNADYSASVSVPKGSIIDTSSITAAIAMKNVASLGVNGTKTYEKTITTGLNMMVALDNYLPSFSSATVSGMIDGVSYGYNFTGTDTAEEFRIDAVPQDEAAVRAAWAALTSHMTAGSKAVDDSYVVVPGAAYIQIGTEKLVFKDENAELKLDNIAAGNSLEESIRAAVKLLEVEELEDAQIEIFLPAGTVLALSNSQVTLNDDATITIYGYAESTGVNTIMSQLRACTSTEAIVKTLVTFISDVATAIDGQNVTVNVEFDHVPAADWTVVAEATCTEDGKQVKYCIMCGEVAVEETIPAIGHDYETVATDATCTEAGYTTYTCKVCGDTYTDDEVPALGHEYTSEVTAPTCTDKGYTTYTCSVCGDVYVADYVDANGHSYEAVVTAPTCTEAGYTTCTCTVCGDTHTVLPVDALGHTAGAVVEENRVEATCTVAGSYEAVTYCTVCNEELTREAVEIPAAGHDYVAVVTAPTCTEAGYTTYTCSVCGDSYVADNTAALGHTPGEWKADAAKPGYWNLFCAICGELLDSAQRQFPVTGIKLDQDFVETKYIRKAVAFTLTETVLPEDQEKLGYTVKWTSSDEKIATVDQDGNVTTHHLGNADITATLYDAQGNVVGSDTCEVKVYYTFWQWLIWIFLLGCAWYFV